MLQSSTTQLTPYSDGFCITDLDGNYPHLLRFDGIYLERLKPIKDGEVIVYDVNNVELGSILYLAGRSDYKAIGLILQKLYFTKKGSLLQYQSLYNTYIIKGATGGIVFTEGGYYWLCMVVPPDKRIRMLS